MSPFDPLIMLRAAAPLLEGGVMRSWLRRHQRRTLAAEIRKAMTAQSEAPDVVVVETTRRWSGDGRVRIERPATMIIDRDGVWLRASVLAGDIAPIDPTALAGALARLPLMTREVYSLSRRDGLTFRQIGKRLGISIDEVGQQLTAAFLELDRSLPGH